MKHPMVKMMVIFKITAICWIASSTFLGVNFMVCQPAINPP